MLTAQRYEFINAGKMQKNWIDAVSQDLKEMNKSLLRKQESTVLTEVDVWSSLPLTLAGPRTKEYVNMETVNTPVLVPLKH